MKKIDTKQDSRKHIDDRRILGRRVAREMTAAELQSVTGGKTTYCECVGDDCGVLQ